MPVRSNMMMLCLAMGSALVSGAGFMDTYQVQEMIFWHNKARGELATAGLCGNMLEMEWDADIATAAETNVCPTTHNGQGQDAYGSDLGENLAWSSGGSCDTGLCEEAGNCGQEGAPACESNCDSSICTIKNRVYTAWYQSETEDPLGITDNCLSFNNGGGHCSQMLWQATNLVGCALQKGCPEWDTTVNCNYSPPGNYINDFDVVSIGDCVTGTACSACPESHPHCSEIGLCSRFESTADDAEVNESDDSDDNDDEGNANDDGDLSSARPSQGVGLWSAVASAAVALAGMALGATGSL